MSGRHAWHSLARAGLPRRRARGGRRCVHAADLLRRHRGARAVNALGAIGVAIDQAVRTVLPLTAAGVVTVDYTPAGGTAQSAHAAVRIHEEPRGGTQERSATLTLFQLEVAA